MTEINQVEISKDRVIQILQENIKSIEEKYEMLLASKEKEIQEQQKEIDFLRETIIFLDNLKLNIPLANPNNQ